MPALESLADPRSPEFCANAAAMQALVADLRKVADAVRGVVAKRRGSGIFRGESFCPATASVR